MHVLAIYCGCGCYCDPADAETSSPDKTSVQCAWLFNVKRLWKPTKESELNVRKRDWRKSGMTPHRTVRNFNTVMRISRNHSNGQRFLSFRWNIDKVVGVFFSRCASSMAKGQMHNMKNTSARNPVNHMKKIDRHRANENFALSHFMWEFLIRGWCFKGTCSRPPNYAPFRRPWKRKAATQQLMLRSVELWSLLNLGKNWRSWDHPPSPSRAEK